MKITVNENGKNDFSRVTYARAKPILGPGKETYFSFIKKASASLAVWANYT